MTAEFVEDYPLTTAKPKGGRDIGAATAHSNEGGDETGETARAVGGNLAKTWRDVDAGATQPGDEGYETARAVGGTLLLRTTGIEVEDERPTRTTAEFVEGYQLLTVRP